MRPRVFAIAFSLAIVLLVLLLFGIIFSPSLVLIDVQLSDAVRSVHAPGLTTVAIWVTSIANTASMLILVPLTALVLWLLGRHSGAIVVLVTVPVGRLLGSLIQVLVHRARPAGVALIALPVSFSFPSGHALTSALYFGTLSFIVLGEVRRPSLRYALVMLFTVLTVAIGLSRVYLGVHFLGDVIAGWLLGWAIVVVALMGYFAFTKPHDN